MWTSSKPSGTSRRRLQDRQAAHRVPVAPVGRAVQGVAGAGRRQRVRMPGRGSLTKPFAHNAINDALKVALQGQDVPASPSTTFGARRPRCCTRMAGLGRGREGAEPHHRRRARRLQPGRVRATAARDAAVLGRLHRTTDDHGHMILARFSSGLTEAAAPSPTGRNPGSLARLARPLTRRGRGTWRRSRHPSSFTFFCRFFKM